MLTGQSRTPTCVSIRYDVFSLSVFCDCWIALLLKNEHLKVTALKPLTAAVKITNHFTTEHCSHGNFGVFAFAGMILDL